MFVVNCKTCGTKITFLKNKFGSNVPVIPSTVTEGEKEFKPNTHKAHTFEDCCYTLNTKQD